MAKVVIIGAGLAGLSTGYNLKRDYCIFEKNPQPGGISGSYTVGNYIFDYTGHLLHFRRPEIQRLVQNLLKNNLIQHQRNSWIFSANTYTPYPFQSNTFGLPQKIVKDCVYNFIDRYCQSIPSETRVQNFYQWMQTYFGKGITRYFMLPYNHKLWTIHPRELTTDWLAGYVPRPGLETVIAGALTNQPRSLGYNATFYYPRKGGIQSLANAFTTKVKRLNLNSEIVKIDYQHRQLTLAKGDKVKYRHLVSTIPLIHLISLLYPVPQIIRQAAGNLRYAGVLNVNLGFKRRCSTNRHWIYFPEKKFNFYRVGYYNNFSTYLTPPNTTSLYIEISYPGGSKKPDLSKHLTETVTGLLAAGIVKDKDEFTIMKVLDIPCAYVIYDRSRKRIVDLILNFLQQNNIYSIGRYGRWEYSTMEDAIFQGQEIARGLNS